MTKSILITGIAGTGKSTVYRELTNRGYEAYDIENIKGLFRMIDKDTGKRVFNFNNNDIESVRQSDWTCDKVKLQDLIKQSKKSPSFYCGTASNIDDLIPLFDKVLLLVASPEIIRTRLASRGPNEFGNTAEIQDRVLGYRDWWEEKLKGKGAQVISADQDIDKTVSSIIKESLN